jgi:hypothetical protein
MHTEEQQTVQIMLNHIEMLQKQMMQLQTTLLMTQMDG